MRRAFWISLLVLTVLGSIAGVALIAVGSSLHGEPIGGPFGFLLMPLFAAGVSFFALLFLACPLCVFAQWLFTRFKWPPILRWIILPLTGPAFFFVLGPLFLLLSKGDHAGDLFTAAADSFVLGCVVSTQWAVFLFLEKFDRRKVPPIPSDCDKP